MDRNYLAIGGGILLFGGLAYWYLSQNPPTPKTCPDYTNESQCVSNGCNWCNNQCQSAPCTGACSSIYQTCYPGVSGLRMCDNSNNVCECSGSAWNLIEQNSQVCINGDTYNKCLVNSDGKAVCIPSAGYGVDQCPTVDLAPMPQGCPCGWGGCQTYFSCDPYSNRCYQKAYEGIPVNAKPDTYYQCEELTAGNVHNLGTRRCYWYTNQDIKACSRLVGTMHYWGAFPTLYTVTFKVYGCNSDAWEWRLLKEKSWYYGAAEHTEEMVVNFPDGIIGIDWLCFEINNIWTPQVEFFGTLSI